MMMIPISKLMSRSVEGREVSGANPKRITFARERRGMTITELAERCGVSQQALSFWEAGKRSPSEDGVRQLASALNFPIDFFSRGDIDRLPGGAATFRARTKLSVRERSSALAAGTMAASLARWIEERFVLPKVDLPELHGQRPDLAAEVVRQRWLLGYKPIPNVIHLLESRGVIVFSLAQDCRDIDAFSFWMGKRPIVMLNTIKSAERSTLDAAHELAHLVLHVEETGKQEETEANSFAGHLLMPESDLRRHVPAFTGMDQLLEAKERWGVSLAALIYRLHEVEILTEWQYRRLYIEISRNNWTRHEPRPMKRQGSALLAQVFSDLRARRITPRSIASELGWNLEDLNEFIFGLGASWTSVEGTGEGSRQKRPDLRLVE